MNPEIQNALQRIAESQTRMREQLIEFSNINSGSFHVAGVNRFGAAMQELLAPLAASSELIALDDFQATANDGNALRKPIGKALRLRQRPDAPLQVFLGGHLDTVFAADHPFQKCAAPDEDTLHGPGVADLKGGLLVMHAALGALESSPWREQIGWEVVLNPDEEIGSEGSAALLREAAARNHIGLIYEPSFPNGNLAGERKGSGNFDVIVRGRAAHAGREHHLGRNALRAAADFIAALDALNGQREGVTINPGFVHGGGALNVVPDCCVFKFNVRTRIAEDQDWMQQQLEQLMAQVNARDGYQIALRGGFTRPPKPQTEANRRLSTMIGDCGKALSMPLAFEATGGCCDGNNLAAAGLPNIDNLGVVGGAIHSDQEHMRVSSLVERGQLSALLLLKLASGEWRWH